MVNIMIDEGEFVPPPAEFGRDERGRIFLKGPKKEEKKEEIVQEVVSKTKRQK